VGTAENEMFSAKIPACWRAVRYLVSDPPASPRMAGQQKDGSTMPDLIHLAQPRLVLDLRWSAASVQQPLTQQITARRLHGT